VTSALTFTAQRPIRSSTERNSTVTKRLDGKVALITGSGGGIGREHAKLFAREGAKVIVNDIGFRAGSDADAVVQEIVEAGGEAVANGDSATWSGADELVAHAIEAFGRVDVLINNATWTRFEDMWNYPEEWWDNTIDVNLKGYFAMIRALTPHMAERGSGAIVNTSSNSGFGHPTHAAYAASKEGVVGLTRTVARELGRFGIRCNAIRPIAGGQSASDYEERTKKWAGLLANTFPPRIWAVQRRMINDPDALPPRKISPLVVWLCTEAASGVNGHTFETHGDVVSLLSEPEPLRSMHQAGGWTLDALDALAPTYLTADLHNDFRLDEHPELQKFTR
jgi:3-oxoacyl-[acyl-carrier protein] reductase